MPIQLYPLHVPHVVNVYYRVQGLLLHTLTPCAMHMFIGMSTKNECMHNAIVLDLALRSNLLLNCIQYPLLDVNDCVGLKLNTSPCVARMNPKWTVGAAHKYSGKPCAPFSSMSSTCQCSYTRKCSIQAHSTGELARTHCHAQAHSQPPLSFSG